MSALEPFFFFRVIFISLDHLEEVYWSVLAFLYPGGRHDSYLQYLSSYLLLAQGGIMNPQPWKLNVDT